MNQSLASGPQSETPTVMIVAAEASSALFAQRLLEHWRKSEFKVTAFGVGTKAMEDLGFERLGKSEEMAVVGAAEIVEAYGHLKSVFNKLVEQAELRKPKVVIVMDYPEFNLMLSKQLHKRGIPVVYYVSPQVWAWRKGRVLTIKKYCEKVLLLFPFEKSFYDSKQVSNEFVGHPILDEMDPKYFQEDYRLNQRRRRGIADHETVIGLMPGSRRGEIKQHLDIQLEVARKLNQNFPNLKILLMVAPTLEKEYLQERLGDLKFPIMIVKDEPFEMINLTDVILAASGTATLMVGLLEKPMVIMYRLKWLTGLVAKLVVRGVRFFGIVNLILDKEAVPERWQKGAEPEPLYQLMARYLSDPGYKASVISDLKKIRPYLGEKGATERVAKSLEIYFNRPVETDFGRSQP